MGKKSRPDAAEAAAPEAAADEQMDTVVNDSQEDVAGADAIDGDLAADDVLAAEDSGDEVTELRTEVARLESALSSERDRLLRTVADMDNLRKRTRREASESRRFAQADLLRPLLEILDNFDRALQHAAEQDGEQDGDQGALRQGVEMIALSFRQLLRDRGVQPIEAEGCPFDPALHEAVGQQPAEGEAESGEVLAVVQEGYTFDDMVLRASRVIVAQ